MNTAAAPPYWLPTTAEGTRALPFGRWWDAVRPGAQR